MITKWIDPQLPYELEEIFLTYGEQCPVKSGETILDFHEEMDTFIYIADGLVAITTEGRSPFNHFIFKLVPEGRALGFKLFNMPIVQSFKIVALRDSIIYTMPFSTFNNLLQNKYINRRIFNKYQNLYERNAHSGNDLFDIYEADGASSTINALRLNDIRYSAFSLIKKIELNEHELEILLKMRSTWLDYMKSIAGSRMETTIKKINLSAKYNKA